MLWSVYHSLFVRQYIHSCAELHTYVLRRRVPLLEGLRLLLLLLSALNRGWLPRSEVRRPPRLGGLILENRGREADGEEHVEHIKEEEDLLLKWSCPLSCIINKLSVPTHFFSVRKWWSGKKRPIGDLCRNLPINLAKAISCFVPILRWTYRRLIVH